MTTRESARPVKWILHSDKREHHLVEIKRTFRAACREAKIEDPRFHDLRHTVATRWAEAGAQPSTIAELLGRAVEKAGRLSEIEKAGHNVVTMKKREA